MTARVISMDRSRLRRRLLLFSAPVAIVVLLVTIKLWTVVLAGGSARSAFAQGDADQLRSDVATLNVLDVVEPTTTLFAAGDLAVLNDRLPEADANFSGALARTSPGASCPVRVNLELVRETMGDRAFAAFDTDRAIAAYRNALATVAGAPGGCFDGSTDADEQRRAVLDGAAARLTGKLDAALAAAPPPPPPPPGAAAPPPPPTGSTTGVTPSQDQLRLNPGSGDPLDRLRQILRDAASARRAGGA